MQDLEKYIEYLTDIIINIDYSKRTVLTGSNASGKSLIRKQLPFQLEYILERKPKVMSTSMERRTSSVADWGALSGSMLDTSWLATSINSIHQIQALVNRQEKADYLVFDEPEVGCSAEVQLGITDFINRNVTKPYLIISHSNHIVENLEYDNFINIEGLSLEQYLTREIKMISLEELEEKADTLFKAIKDLEKKKKK